MDSGAIKLGNQAYQFLVGLLPGGCRVLVDLPPVDETHLSSIEDRIRMTEERSNRYAEDDVSCEVSWKRRNEQLQERHIVCDAAGSVKATLDIAKTLAAVRIPILICGSSGAGKELLARLMHENSGMQDKFVAFNCATTQLLDSEAKLVVVQQRTNRASGQCAQGHTAIGNCKHGRGYQAWRAIRYPG